MFVAGDLCSFVQDGKQVPGVAPAAMQEGDHAARNVLRQLAGKQNEPFAYWDKGSLATIGRAAAVAEIGWFRLSGLLAWLAWLGIHIMFLIGFRNRAIVLFEWGWAYVTNQRGARLITERVYESWRTLWGEAEAADTTATPAAGRVPASVD